MRVGDKVEIPPDVYEIKTDGRAIVFGPNQIRTCLFAHLEDSGVIYQFTRTMQNSYVLVNKFYRSDNKVIWDLLMGFIDDIYPFYIIDGNLYNRYHNKVRQVTPLFLTELWDSFIYKRAFERYIWERPRKHIMLWFDGSQLAILQKATLPKYANDAILLDDILFNNFKLDSGLIRQVAHMPSIDEAISFLKQEMMFCII
jgi:hypothetical protein